MRESSFCTREPALGVGHGSQWAKKGNPGSRQGKLFVELGVVTDTQYRLGLETSSEGLNLSPENIDAWKQVQTFTPPRPSFLEKDTGTQLRRNSLPYFSKDVRLHGGRFLTFSKILEEDHCWVLARDNGPLNTGQ